MPSASPSADLRDGAEPAWSELADHPFVVELASGTLATERFRYYIEQNVLYLRQYARVMALGAARARDQRELELCSAALRQVVEVELPENLRLRDRVVELGAFDRGGANQPAPANLEYAAWLLSVAFSGGAPEILAAVLPCTWSYGEIGQRLAPAAAEHPVYRAWLEFFAGDAYAAVVARMRSDLDELSARAEPAALRRIFATGVRFERRFWDMAYAMSGGAQDQSGA